MVRAVVFDIGGVLEVTPPTGWQDAWCGRLGLTRDEFRDRLHDLPLAGSLGHVTYDDYVTEVGRRLTLDEAQTTAFMDDIWAEYLGTPNTELIDYFASLRGRVRTGILSNSLVGAREREQDLYGFSDRYDVVVYSHEEGLRKPESAFYGLVCERLQVDPSDVLFVDDLPMCIEGAEAVGMTGVLHRDNATTIAAVDAALGG